MSDWQPIETAPSGENVLLIVGFDIKRVVLGVKCFDGNNDYWWILDEQFPHKATETYTGMPTHWMPLPEPPK